MAKQIEELRKSFRRFDRVSKDVDILRGDFERVSRSLVRAQRQEDDLLVDDPPVDERGPKEEPGEYIKPVKPEIRVDLDADAPDFILEDRMLTDKHNKRIPIDDTEGIARAVSLAPINQRRIVIAIKGKTNHTPNLCGAVWGPKVVRKNATGVPIGLDLVLVGVDATAGIGSISTHDTDGRIDHFVAQGLDLHFPEDSYGGHTHHINKAGLFGFSGCRYVGHPKMNKGKYDMHRSAFDFNDPFDDLIIEGQKPPVTAFGYDMYFGDHGLAYIKNQGNVYIVKCYLPHAGRTSFQIRPHTVDPSNQNAPYGTVLVEGCWSDYAEKKKWLEDKPYEGGSLATVWYSAGGGMCWIEGNAIDSKAGAISVEWQPASNGNYTNARGYTHEKVVVKNCKFRSVDANRSPAMFSAIEDLRFVGSNEFEGNGRHGDLIFNSQTASYKWGAPPVRKISFESQASRNTKRKGTYSSISGMPVQIVERELAMMTGR